MEIIALSGYARAGKDEAASVLVNEYGFTQVAFADKLREMLYALDPLVSDQNGWITVQQVIDKYGWNGYKETIYSREIRRLLQRLGTEAGRQTLWDSIWIDATLTGFDESDKIVVSDARFFNEFDAVRNRGGRIWRIEREGVGPISDHPSETEAPRYPFFELTIYNNGTLEDYHNLVRRAYNDQGKFTKYEGKLIGARK